jgi:hypothetical protein
MHRLAVGFHTFFILSQRITKPHKQKMRWCSLCPQQPQFVLNAVPEPFSQARYPESSPDAIAGNLLRHSEGKLLTREKLTRNRPFRTSSVSKRGTPGMIYV